MYTYERTNITLPSKTLEINTCCSGQVIGIHPYTEDLKLNTLLKSQPSMVFCLGSRPSFPNQKRLWTADRLHRRGWENCGPCQLCKQTEENYDHLFVHCRYTVRIWELLKEWLGLQGIYPRLWTGLGIYE
jgi:hypothetical protein